MIKFISVTGDSLTPEFKQGDFVVIATSPFFYKTIKRGDVLVFRHEMHGTLIKKFSHYEGDDRKLYVTGTHPLSIDSENFGPINREELIGKVIWHIPRPVR